jgi:predicted chitinase
MDISELKRFARGGDRLIVNGVAEHWDLAESAGIDTPQRICHFMAQLAHESDSLHTCREYASGTKYEGREDIGNTEKGDGVRFRGRGLIQVTGRANHVAFTAWARKRYSDAPDFVREPEKLEQFPWALLSAVWYWDSRGLNKFADKNDIRSITKKVNGGYNGLADRRAWFRKAVALWGEGEVNETGKPFLLSRAVKAASAGGSAVGITSLYEVSSALHESKSIAETLNISFPVLLIIGALVLVVGYLIYDRYFIAQHEGL